MVASVVKYRFAVKYDLQSLLFRKCLFGLVAGLLQQLIHKDQGSSSSTPEAERGKPPNPLSTSKGKIHCHGNQVLSTIFPRSNNVETQSQVVNPLEACLMLKAQRSDPVD